MADKHVTVRPSGGTYTSLSAAIAGELSANANLVTMDGILYIDIEGTWSADDSTKRATDGFTTDASHYLHIRNNGATDYRLRVNANDFALATGNAYDRVTGIRIANTGAGHGVILAGAYVTMINCWVYDAGAGGYSNVRGSDSEVPRLINCLASGCGGVGFTSLNDTHTGLRCYNCASVNNTGAGFAPSTSNTYFNLTNCYAGGNGGTDISDGSGLIETHTTCYSEDQSHGTSLCAWSTDNFTNVTAGSEDLSLAAASALIGHGTDLSADAVFPFDYDYTGATRSAPWDVGPYAESAPAGGNLVGLTSTGTTGKPTLTQTLFFSPSGLTSTGTLGVPAWGQSVIINHSNFDPAGYTNQQILDAAALKAYFEHASVGQDIVGDGSGMDHTGSAPCGLANLETENARYTMERTTWSSTNDYTWYSTHTGLGDNNRGNPSAAVKLAAFAGLSSDMIGAVDIAFFKFCYIDTPANGALLAADVIAALTVMQGNNPGLKIPYWTMPLETTAYAERQIFNDAIRTHCVSNSAILFDIADIESHNDAGVAQVDGNGREILTSAYTSDGGHLNATGGVKLAKAYWSLLVALTEGVGTPSGLTSTGTVGKPTVSQSIDFSVDGLTSTGTLGRLAAAQTHSVVCSGIRSAGTVGKPSASRLLEAGDTVTMGTATKTLRAVWVPV